MSLAGVRMLRRVASMKEEMKDSVRVSGGASGPLARPPTRDGGRPLPDSDEEGEAQGAVRRVEEEELMDDGLSVQADTGRSNVDNGSDGVANSTTRMATR
eukprot:6588507-Heterocapsa_arctica.AAC.1